MAENEPDPVVEYLCALVSDSLLRVIPKYLQQEARAWTASLGTDEVLEQMRDEHRLEVDRVIRGLLRGEGDIEGERLPVIAMLMDRLIVLPELLKRRPPESTETSIAELLEVWVIGVFGVWRRERQRPFARES